MTMLRRISHLGNPLHLRHINKLLLITVTLRYAGKGKATGISLDTIAMRFDDIHSQLTRSSKLESDWSSPCAKVVELSGNATLNDVKVIGIKVVAL
jgi:hypothetical protein